MMKTFARVILYLLSIALILIGLTGLLANKFEANPAPIMYFLGAAFVAAGFGLFFLAGKMKAASK